MNAKGIAMFSQVPTNLVQIESYGPVIDVVIKPTRGNLAGLSARGLIDTGAHDIIISTSIVKKLGLRFTGDEAVLEGVGGGGINAKVFSGILEVPGLNFRKVLPLHAVGWKQDNHTMLLGREFLQYFIFNYDGPKGMLCFTNPIGNQFGAFESYDEDG